MSQKKRERFNRYAVASSRGNYVRKAHNDMIRQCHESNKDIVLNISLRIPPKYFVRCFGKLIQVIAREAMMLKRTTKVFER